MGRDAEPTPVHPAPVHPAPAPQAPGGGRAAWERFGIPAALCLPFLVLTDAQHVWDGPVLSFLLVLAVIWVFTAALTPRSGGLTRGTGYVAVAVFSVGMAWDTWWVVGSRWMSGIMSRATGTSVMGPAELLLYLACVATVLAYCYREVSTRRARSAHHR